MWAGWARLQGRRRPSQTSHPWPHARHRPPPPPTHAELPPSLPPQALHATPALAGEVVPSVAGSASKQQAEELQRLLEQRGAKLPELKSSPQVRGAAGLVPMSCTTGAA